MKQVNIKQCLIEIRRSAIEDVIGLRQDTIIAGTDRNSPYFDGDRDEATRHYGAFLEDQCIGVLSLMLNAWQGVAAWQLRGMASRDDWRGCGLGRILLEYALEDTASETGISLFWCNARTGAAEFYEKFGWRRESEEFAIPGVGPHFKMTYRLEKRG